MSYIYTSNVHILTDPPRFKTYDEWVILLHARNMQLYTLRHSACYTLLRKGGSYNLHSWNI